MRYFSKEDLESDNGSKELVYSSSRLVYDDIARSMGTATSSSEEKKDETKIGDSTDRMSLRKKENSEKQIPSFFSRTYTSWTLLTEKMSVYTPVSRIPFLFLFSSYHISMTHHFDFRGPGSRCVPIPPSYLADPRECLQKVN
jgi:hypothetical protein